MGTAEDWGKLIGTVAAIIVEVAERRADICSLCGDKSASLFPVSRGRLCLTCVAVAHLELARDWRKLKEENEEFRALFREFQSTGTSAKQVVEAMAKVAADLKEQMAENGQLRQAAIAAESECRAAREANALLREQAETAQREAESLQLELEAVRAERAAGAAQAAAPAVLTEIQLLLHPKIADHILGLAASSASSPMARSVEGFLKAIMLAALRRMEALQGSSQQIIDALQMRKTVHRERPDRSIVNS